LVFDVGPDTYIVRFGEKIPLAVTASRRNRLRVTDANILSSGGGHPICWDPDQQTNRDRLDIDRGQNARTAIEVGTFEDWPGGGRMRDDEWMRTG
jgi:hypothetical protein